MPAIRPVGLAGYYVLWVRNSAIAAAPADMILPMAAKEPAMSHLDSSLRSELKSKPAKRVGDIQHTQIMLLAAGIAAFGIVAVAAAMMTTLR